jgi:hypothetical protein
MARVEQGKTETTSNRDITNPIQTHRTFYRSWYAVYIKANARTKRFNYKAG